MPTVPYQIEEDRRRCVVLIVLQADETIEDEFRTLMPQNVRLMVSRVPSGPEVTSETLAEMARHLGHAASLLPRAVTFDAIAYACTSGAAEIGSKEVARLIRETASTRATTTPVDALVAACRRHKVRRLNLLTPYIAEVSDRLIAVLADHGVEVVGTASFDEADEARVARISATSITDASKALAGTGSADAMFLSCTNLRTAGLLAPLSERIGCPVWSSNQILAWHLLRLCDEEADALQVRST